MDCTGFKAVNRCLIEGRDLVVVEEA